MKHDSVYIVVPGAPQGGRIGIVKYKEPGYYQTDFDNAPVSLEIVESVVKRFNEKLDIPADVVEAMHAGSMFGWDVPAAKAAHDYYAANIRLTITEADLPPVGQWKAAAQATPHVQTPDRYALEAGRVITIDGKPAFFISITPVNGFKSCLSPVEADKFAHYIVTLLTQAHHRSLE